MPWPRFETEGIRVSIDSFDPAEVALAVAAGAELVLSVNGATGACARDWGVEVVAIPDQPGSLDGLDQTIEFLDRRGCAVSHRPDPRADRLWIRGLARPLSSRSAAVIPRRR